MGAALVWGAVASSSLVIGALLAGVRSWPPRRVGMVLAFGAGALLVLLVLLVDSMIPEATRDSGRVAGLVTTLGFAVAAALSSVA
ncbi:MAG TPA: hypothetical protein VIS95_05625 [Solirubrobacterales bacterium]